MAQQTDIDRIATASLSETGPTRSDNQDLYGDFRHASGGRLLILADGMGGHRGGALASRTCVDAFFTIFDDQVGSPEDWLKRTFAFANDRVYEAARSDPELKGMGTTGVALLFAPDGTAWVGWVGDSRLYRLRNGELKLLTEDHSLVAEWVRMGVLTPEQAAQHPRRSELTRAIGISAEIEPETRAIEVLPGDRFLLCSDGLHGVVHERQIKVVLGSEPPQEAVRTLVDRAVELGGPDNITVQIAVVAPEGGELGPGASIPAAAAPLPRATKIVPPMMEPAPEAEPDSSLHLPSLVGGMILAVLLLVGGYAWLTTFGPGQRPETAAPHDPSTRESEPRSGAPEPRHLEPAPQRTGPAEQRDEVEPATRHIGSESRPGEAVSPQAEPAPPAGRIGADPQQLQPTDQHGEAEKGPQQIAIESHQSELMRHRPEPDAATQHIEIGPQRSEPAPQQAPAEAATGQIGIESQRTDSLPGPTGVEPPADGPSPTPETPAHPGAGQPPPASPTGAEETVEAPQAGETGPVLVAEADVTALEEQGIDVSELQPDENGFVYVPVPVPVPTSEGFDLPDAVRSFVDAWMRAAAGRDYQAYQALGFPEQPEEFEATYGQWEAFQLRTIEIEESRTTDERIYLRLVLSYAFHTPDGRWRTEDEHRLVLHDTPGGLRYEARWK